MASAFKRTRIGGVRLQADPKPVASAPYEADPYSFVGVRVRAPGTRNLIRYNPDFAVR